MGHRTNYTNKLVTENTRISTDFAVLGLQAILAANGLEGVFDTIQTNPAEVITGEHGEQLHVVPYTAAHGGHSCGNCPGNLCKTAALMQSLGPNGAGNKTIYVGNNPHRQSISSQKHKHGHTCQLVRFYFT